MKQTNFPPGWDDERVKRVLAHYDHQTEEDAVAEDEAVESDGNRSALIERNATPK